MSNQAETAGVVVPPPFLYLGALVVVVILRWYLPMRIVADSSFLWHGLALMAPALAFGIWGQRTLMAAGTNVSPLRPTTTLVRTGPFRFSRNPLYVGMTLLYAGLTLSLNTWWGLIMLVPVLAVMIVGVIRREERYLEQKFGDAYRQYCSEVRRFL